MPDLIFPGQLPSGTINQSLPANYDLSLWQGDAVKFYVAFSGSTGPMDLSGVTVSASMRANFTSTTLYDFDCTVTDAANGQVQVYLPSSTSQTITPGSYVWSFEMTDANGDVRTYLAGDAVVYAEVPIVNV